MGDKGWQGRDGCPHCRVVVLEAERALGVNFLRCRRCRGVWIGVSHLTAYIEAATKDPAAGRAFRSLLSRAILDDEADGAQLRYCIRCETHLERFGFGEYPFLIADRCIEHGLWLDDGDMERVVRGARATADVADGDAHDDDGPEARRAESAVDLGAGPFACPNCGRRYPESAANQRCGPCNVVLYRA